MTMSRLGFWAVAFGLATGAALAAETPPPDEFWPGLKRDFFQDRTIVENPGFITLDAPQKAEDAALVPMKFLIRAPQGDPRHVVKISLLIDENPIPDGGRVHAGAKRPRSCRSPPACASTPTRSCIWWRS